MINSYYAHIEKRMFITGTISSSSSTATTIEDFRARDNSQMSKEDIERIESDTSQQFPPSLEVINPPISDSVYKTYTSYSGCDFIVSVNDKIFGETNSIMYYNPSDLMSEQIVHGDFFDVNLASKYPCVLSLGYTLFNSNEFLDEFKKKTVNMTISFMNEYGDKSMISILDVILISDSSGVSVASSGMEGKLILGARKICSMIKLK